LICTSGTAVANLFPAVIEASIEHVPMLLLTADRPPELREAGANQTIFQPGIFGRYPSWSFDLPCPTPAIPLEFVSSTVEYALSKSRFGPVHLNCMIREPFFAFPDPSSTAIPEAVTRVACCGPGAAQRQWDGQSGHGPLPELTLPGGPTIGVAGAGPRKQSQAAQQLAARLGAVFLSDVTSQLHEQPLDAGMLRGELPAPRTVIHVGGRVTSARWQNLVNSSRPDCYCHLSPQGERIDPGHCVTQRWVLSHPAELDQVRLAEPSDIDFAHVWQTAGASTMRDLHDALAGNLELFEAAIAHEIGQRIPSGQALFLGNSMPIRDVDRYACWSEDREILVGANRGASGIDGLIASSVGFARGSQRVTTALIGDLSCLHDLNSLALLQKSPIPVILIVINNNGGGIFHYLPVARKPSFEELFVMPQHLGSFRDSAGQFGIHYLRLESLSEFGTTYSALTRAPRTALLELPCDRVRNHRFSDQLCRGFQEKSIAAE
jgi:2-succinyl-5-enolpyruvyl-6-hydroxy-3-cyclohexene-1-carboxylate synthase